MEYPGIYRNPTPEVVVTAGGTREQIDDVRFIGNFASGSLGHALAEEFTELGSRVLLLAPRETLERHGKIPGAAYLPFTDFESLQTRMTNLDSPQIIIHSAAVSDYSPEKTNGKISSDEDELTIRMRRNPKILGALRGIFGANVYIVGFKLLSNVSEEELIETARRQIETSQTDMCIANDLQKLRSKRTVHTVERGNPKTQRIVAPTKLVARHLASRILLNAQDNSGQSNE